MISSPGCAVLGERRSRVELDAHLDGLASGGAEIVPLEIGALDVPTSFAVIASRHVAAPNRFRRSAPLPP